MKNDPLLLAKGHLLVDEIIQKVLPCNLTIHPTQRVTIECSLKNLLNLCQLLKNMDSVFDGELLGRKLECQLEKMLECNGLPWQKALYKDLMEYKDEPQS